MRTIVAAVLAAVIATPALSEAPPSYRLRFLGHGTTAFALNELGDAVGWHVPSSGNTRAWVTPRGGPLTFLPLPAGYISSAAYDINDAGVIAGNVSTFYHSSISPVAAVWRPSAQGYQVQVLGGLPGHPYSAAMALNNRGDIVGGSGTTGYGYYWRNAVRFTDQGVVPILDWLSCADVNDERVVLSGTQLLDLDTMNVVELGLPPGNWQGIVSNDLNDRNDVSGRIMNWNSNCNTFPIRYLQGLGWQTIGGCANYTSAVAINNRRDTLHFVENTLCRVLFEGIGDYPVGQLIDPSQGVWYVMWYGCNDINDARTIVATVKDVTQTQIGAAILTPIGPMARGAKSEIDP